MDYVVGSIAALISGNVTPNRPKLIRRALTSTKHPSSPNVTPKSEFVEDRSIFLSPTQQKKKAIVKKSPKRIFENPDLDITENNEVSSPKADKVKKHLEEELEADTMGKSSLLPKKSPSNKLDTSIQSDSLDKKSKINDSQVSKEHSPKKKRKSQVEVSNNIKVEEMDVDQTTEIDKKDTKSPKKIKKQKPAADIDNTTDNQTQINEATENPVETVEETKNTQEGKKKKNKKRKKKNKAKPVTDTVEIKNEVNNKTAKENKAKSPKKKNRKNKKAKSESNELISANVDQETTAKDESNETEKQSENNKQHLSNPVVDDNDDEDDDNDDGSDEEISNVANPNAITEKDTDSEHESDDEIESENEEINEETSKADDAGDSSDDEDVTSKKGAKKKKKEGPQKPEDKGDESPEKEVNTEEEVKRTLFVGNVPFSNKCKKEIKKIFAEYGDIETVRIRTVPVKDGRVTPKLAVIRNEIHPDRSTVNVYVKFTDPDSVDRALAANNTVLSNHHLRVSRSGSTGVEHDPRCAIFLGNLPFGIEDETLRAKFEKCGEIQSVRIVRDKKTNAGKGFGYVNFASKDGVELALGLSEEDLTVKNRIIRVKRCTHTLSKGSKNINKSVKQGPRKDFGNNQGPNKNFGNNQGPNRNFGNNQGTNRNFGNNQGPNRNFGNQNRNPGPNRNFGNNQGPNRNFSNNQGQRSFGNQGPNRNFGNQGPNRNFGNQGPNKNFDNQGPRNFGNAGNEASGASRRIMNKRPNQETSDGPPIKKQNVSQPPREKKQKKEFVGLTGEKKKKQKFNKDSKKKKALSEIMTKT